MKVEKIDIEDVLPVVEKEWNEALDIYNVPKSLHKSDLMKYEEDVLKYGVIMKDNVIWMSKKDYVKENEDTKEKMQMYTFSSISNFSIQIMQHLEDEKFPQYLVKMCNNHKRTRTYNCKTEDFSALMNFKKLLGRYGNFHFTGNAIQFERLKGMLMEKMGDGALIYCLGWQTQHKFFAFNNVALNGQVYSYNENGVAEINGKSFYVPSANKIFANNATRYMNQKRVVYKEGVTFSQWAIQMKKVHREHSVLAILFAASCLFSDHVFKKVNFFPMFFLYGEASTGKGKMIEALQTLFGVPQAPMTITGKANTDKGKIRKFAQIVNMIVFLEEFRNDVNSAVIEMLKGLHTRMGYERGNLDGPYDTEQVPISSGVMITGNYYPQDDALMSRLIIDEMHKNNFTQEEKDQFNVLNDMMQDGYSGIIKELIQHRDLIEKQFYSSYKEVEKELRLELGSITGCIDRMYNNHTVLGAIYMVLHKKIDFPFTWDEVKQNMIRIVKSQSTKRDSGGEVARFWDVFLSAVSSGWISNETVKFEGGEISFNFSLVYGKYLEIHAKQYRESGLRKNTLRDKLEKSLPYIGKKKSDRINGKVTSTMTFQSLKIGQEFHDSLTSLWDSKHFIPNSELRSEKNEPTKPTSPVLFSN